jgi:hypothetical protein
MKNVLRRYDFPHVFYAGDETVKSILLNGIDQRVLVCNINKMSEWLRKI